MQLLLLAESGCPRWARARALLGRGAPVRLQAQGDTDILTRAPLVALFCSLKCPGDLVLATYDLARTLRDRGVAAIGGFHTPMEREALDILNNQGGRKYAALIFSDVYPLPTKRLTEAAAKATEIVNVEQNATGQLAKLIRSETGIKTTRSVLKYDGRQISGREIADRLDKEGEK